MKRTGTGNLPGLLAAFTLLLLSVASHGPAWLVGSALSFATGGTLALTATQGNWYEGTGYLVHKGEDDALPISWHMAWQRTGVRLTLTNSIQGDLACKVFQGCTANLEGRLPLTWLTRLAPPIRSLGLSGQIAWQLPQLQIGLDGGGSANLEWQTDALDAHLLELRLGRYAGRVSAHWSGIERAPSGRLELASLALPGETSPLAVSASGSLGTAGLSLTGQVKPTPSADPRYGRLLQMLGLTSAGGGFHYQSTM